MSGTIDKRVVEASFENEKFEKGVSQTLGTIDKLKKALNFKDSEKSFSGITSAAQKVNLGSIADGIDRISSRFSAMGIVGITILTNLVNTAYQAGLNIAKALVIDPIKTGLNEYETKLNSVQTILANTQKEGTDLKTVTAALDQLNEYSDKTIYNFQQMTRNVGTFTAAGVKLDVSVAAIKGIANLAAISGSNADQASTAMYQLSQALSTGTVRLMDWNSVVNAGMGGAVFQDAIKETARVHGVAVDQIIKDEGSFRDSLQKGWLTSEILTETLSKFTGDLNADQLRTMGYSEEQIASIIKLGQTANDAATKVKTFSQLFSTLKEAAQSGWAKTWELIIGDFEEAKVFLTDLNNTFSAMLGASADARNALVQGWKDLGGRTALIEAFRNLLYDIQSVIRPISDAFREIFPPVTAQQIFNISKGIENLTKKLSLSGKGAGDLKRIFRGIFAVFDIVKMAVFSLGEQLLKLIGSFSSTGEGLVGMAAKFGDWLVKLRDSIKQSDIFTTIFSNIAKVIKPVLEGIIGIFQAIIGGFASMEGVSKSDSLANFLSELGEKFKTFGKIGVIISKVFGLLSKAVEKLGPIVSKILSKLGDLGSKLLDAMTRGLDKLDTGKILDFLNKGLLAGVLLSITDFVNKSKSVVGGGLFAGILLSIKNFIDQGGSIFKNAAGILDSVKSSLDAYQKTLKANTLLKIAGAIALLALAIIALSLVNQDRLITATAVIGAMFVGLTTTLDVFEKTTGGGTKLLAMTAALLGISLSLLVLAGAVLILSKLDPKEALQGVAAAGAILGILLLFQKFSTGATGLGGVTLGLLGLSVALLGLSLAIKSFGGMEKKVLEQGLVGIAGALTIMAVAMNAMNASMAGSASMVVAAGSILILAAALKVMGSMSLEEIGLSLLALAGAFTILGIAGTVLTPIAPTLALIAVSLLAIGLAVAAVGAGIGVAALGLAALATGIVALSAVSAGAMAAITLIVTGIAALIPILAVQVVKGITAFLVELAKSGPKIAIAFMQIGVQMLSAFATLTPQIVTTILKLILDLQKALLEKLPDIVQAGYDIMLGFLQGLSNNIEDVATVAYGIVKKFMGVMSEQIPDFVNSGYNMIIAFIDGMSATAEENIPRIMESLRNLGLAVVKGIIKGVLEGMGDISGAIVEIAKTIIDSFKRNLGINSPSTVFIALAGEIIRGLVSGLAANAGLIVTQMINLGTRMVESVKGRYDSMLSAGRDLISGLAQGINSYISTAIKAAEGLALAVLNKIKQTLGIHSPSDEMIDAGMFIDQGLAIGITKFGSVVARSVNDLGTQTVDRFKDVISRISDSVDSNMDLNPTIRPVIDLTDIQKSKTQLDGIFGKKTLNLSVAASKASTISTPTQASVDSSGKVQQVKGGDVIFNQNNYSPKELSRVDIYRQTKNQLYQAKDLVSAK